MQVQHILKSKSDDAVVTVPPGTSVTDAARILAERKIGTVVISPDGCHAQGILSERDIVREISNRGAGVLQDPVDRYMTTELVVCDRNEKAEVVLTKMTEGRFRHMPVVENGEMVGLITLGDVVKARLSELSNENDALQGMIMGF